MPILLRRKSTSCLPDMAVKSSPSMKILPAVGSVNREMQRKSVDLPEPDRPITTNNSPFCTSNVALLTPTIQPAAWKAAASTTPAELRIMAAALSPKIL